MVMSLRPQKDKVQCEFEIYIAIMYLNKTAI